MAIKYKTNIEITSEAKDRDEAMEIVGEYLSGNIISGIDMKCTTKPVRFYSHTASKVTAMLILITIGFLSGVKTKGEHNLVTGICQTDAVQAPLKTSAVFKKDLTFRKEWDDKQTREALNIIKK